MFVDPDDVWRCWSCGKGYKTAPALKVHITRTHTKRSWRGSTAEKDTKIGMRREMQHGRPHANCEGDDIENVWTFRYLGSYF